MAIVIIPVVVHFATKKGSEDYLSQDRIEAIIKNYQDSLKNEIFDGFYLVPAVWDGIQRDYPIQLPEVGKKEVYVSNAAEGVLDSIHAKSPQDVFDRFKGRHNVVNNDGVVMPLPGIANGIDSLLIVDKPFIEYLDDNGIRRVVALLNNDIYYFAGYCGSHDNFRQYVMIDRNGKYGLVDENGTVIKDFFNDEIAPSANNYYIKNGGEKQYYSFAGKPLDESPEKSQDNTRQLKVEHYYGNTYPKKSAFIDPSGRVVAIFDNISCYSHKGFYEVRGPNGYGIYNANLQKIEVPLKYEDISEDGADVNLFPAKKNGKWGYVSGGGVESIGFRFKNAYSFDPDTKLACVKDEVYADKYGYIDVSGNYKILPQYNGSVNSEVVQQRLSR